MKRLVFLIPSIAGVIFPVANALACPEPPPVGVSVPEPMTMLLVGCGILGLGVLRRRFK